MGGGTDTLLSLLLLGIVMLFISQVVSADLNSHKQSFLSYKVK